MLDWEGGRDLDGTREALAGRQGRQDSEAGDTQQVYGAGVRCRRSPVRNGRGKEHAGLGESERYGRCRPAQQQLQVPAAPYGRSATGKDGQLGPHLGQAQLWEMGEGATHGRCSSWDRRRKGFSASPKGA